MTDEELVDRFRGVRSWVSGDQRAPHKPLLLLLALSALRRTQQRWIAFRKTEPTLRVLLTEFGPPRQSVHPEYPFWRLRNDGFWLVPEEAMLRPRQNGSGDVAASALRRAGARGGFDAAVFEALTTRPDVMNTIVSEMLARTFPESLHDAVVHATEYAWVTTGRVATGTSAGHVRDNSPASCAFCGAEVGESTITAVHVKWRAAGGPDALENVVALCKVHRLALDSGLLSLDDSECVLVSAKCFERTADKPLVKLAGRSIRGRRPEVTRLRPDFLEWHRREVFRAPGLEPAR